MQLPDIFPLFKEVLTGIFGAVTVSAIAIIFSFFRDWLVKRRYPVAGVYVTYFDDLVDGSVLVQTAMSRIYQRGSKISGHTTLKSGRKWILNGSIMGIGHISGIYSAEAIEDEGVGSFYLRFSRSRLDGMWAGYDHVNKRTTSGRYVFEKVIPVQIAKLTKSNVPAVLAIADNEFGPNYISSIDFQSGTEFDTFVAIYNEKVVGFVLGGISLLSPLLGKDNKLTKDLIYAENNCSLGIIRSIAVASNMQRHGIGDKLFIAMERHLRSKSCSMIAVPAWMGKKGVHLDGILLSNGYESFLRSDNYWKEDCDKNAFSCKERADGLECCCNLILYKKQLS